MKKLLVTVCMLITFTSLFAQPSWTPVIYTNSTIAYGIVTINGIPAKSGDKVGAFVANECRAIGNVTINSGTAYVSLIIQGEKIETTSFKVWQASTNSIINVLFTTQTNPGSIIGSPPNYLPIASSSSLRGDVNGNGIIEAYDASLILQYVVGLKELTDSQKNAADANNDGVVGALDASLVLYFVANGQWPQ